MKNPNYFDLRTHNHRNPKLAMNCNRVSYPLTEVEDLGYELVFLSFPAS